MRVDFCAEFAALRDHPVNLQVSDPCKIHIGIGKCASGAGRHPHPLGDQGPEAQNTTQPRRTVDLDQSSLKNPADYAGTGTPRKRHTKNTSQLFGLR